MLFNKFARRLLSTVITSVTFSLGCGGFNAITEEHKKEIFSWAKIMNFNEEEVLKRLKFETSDGKEFYLVPVYKLDKIKEFLREFFKELYYDTSCTKQPFWLAANSESYICRYAFRSLNFLLMCDGVLVGKVSLLKGALVEGIRLNKVIALVHKDYRKLGIRDIIMNICNNNTKFIMQGFDYNEMTLNLEMIFKLISENSGPN